MAKPDYRNFTMAGKPRPARRRARAPQLRLLPVTIVVALAVLIVRVNDIWTSFKALDLPEFSLSQSAAQQPPPPGGKKKKNDPQPTQPVPATATPATGSSAQTGTTGGQSASASGGDAAPAPAAVPGGQATEGEPPIFTQNEVDVLEKLSARRQALDGREHDIELRENLLKAAEDRIDKKIAEMKALQSDVKVMLQKIDEQDDARLKSLVKIYETMNPKEAARIFEQLDMPILLGVVGNMKEQKVAAVMEVMDPAKAKLLTDALAARRATKIEGRTAAAANPADTGTPAPAAAPAPAGAAQNQPNQNPPAPAPAPGG